MSTVLVSLICQVLFWYMCFYESFTNGVMNQFSHRIEFELV